MASGKRKGTGPKEKHGLFVLNPQDDTCDIALEYVVFFVFFWFVDFYFL